MGADQQETIYKFSGFSDRDTTFHYVKRLWSNVSPYAKDDSESEPSENDDNHETMAGASGGTMF